MILQELEKLLVGFKGISNVVNKWYNSTFKCLLAYSNQLDKDRDSIVKLDVTCYYNLFFQAPDSDTFTNLPVVTFNYVLLYYLNLFMHVCLKVNRRRLPTVYGPHFI
jgi:hypothetical protein